MQKIISPLLAFLLSLSFVSISPAQVGSSEPFKNGVVSSAEVHASEAGINILKQGGNAVDAAVAVQFALAVTYPQAGNIGGGGFMVLHQADGTVNTLDFREKAPQRSSRDMYLDENGEYIPQKSRVGGLASGVPGTVDGMINALERHGSLPLEVVMEPAIRLAEQGFELSYSQAGSLNRASERLSRFEGSEKAFVKQDGWERGDLFVQQDLAETLQRIARMGRRGFYSGVTARLLVEEMQRSDGIINLRDLRDYESVWRKPIKSSFGGYDLYMMPPPSSGGFVMKQVFEMLENENVEEMEFNSADYIHLLAETLRRSFADRNYWLGDPDYAEVPLDELIDPAYIRNRMADFSPGEATPSDEVSQGEVNEFTESYETTNFSVVDRYGNAVAVNTTLNGSYGSFVTVTGAGFLLNNEMDDFSAKPGEPNMFGLIGAEANSIEPGKRMLSSMSPTIATKDGKPRFIGGGAGGPRIITATMQNFLNMALFDMNAQKAISAPRVHHQWLPDVLYTEGQNLSPDTKERLKKLGHEFREVGNIALTHFILLDENGTMFGAADPRSNGSVIGY